MAEPWAFIAHKDEFWAGVCAADVPRPDLTEFIGDFVADGFSIMTVHSRAEYDATLAKMKFWHESPEWLMKHGKVVAHV